MRRLLVLMFSLIAIGCTGSAEIHPELLKRPNPTSNKKIKVMVIDTGIVPHELIVPYLEPKWVSNIVDYRFKVTTDSAESHGTHIAGVILFGDLENGPEPVCGEVELHSCNYYNGADNVTDSIKCMNRALELKVDFVNYSSGGTTKYPDELAVIQKLSRNGIKIIVAAGNERSQLSKHPYYPASYALEDLTIQNLIAVGNIDTWGNKVNSSNFTGGIVVDYGDKITSTYGFNHFVKMTGTSQATAMYTHRLLLRKCKQIQMNLEK
jgi:subtilisin family serine protease